MSLNQAAFLQAIENRCRDEGLSRRELARRLDLSSSTFTRLAQGHRPDIDTFVKVVAWLGRPAESFFEKAAPSEPEDQPKDTVREISASLHRDPNLSTEQASTIEDIVRVAYHRLRET